MTAPVHNQVVVFTKVPPASYVTAGVAYRVDRPKAKGAFRFVNVATGGSTSDPAWAVARSEWKTA